jgi:hypothetical protein
MSFMEKSTQIPTWNLLEADLRLLKNEFRRDGAKNFVLDFGRH